MARRAFYSFHYEPDNWRTAQVRNMGVIEGNRPATDNGWESVKRGGAAAIKRWIADQMHGRSCTVVLVGANTADRKWINHEIVESWNQGMGVVGIRIHGLQDKDGLTAMKGRNPFDFIEYGQGRLSDVVKCYDPAGYGSRGKYDWISKHLANAVEEAIRLRGGRI